MKAGKYSIKDLFVNAYIDQIIIPEIQRDYVWGKEQVIGLLNSIKSDYDAYCNAEVRVESADPAIKKLFEDFYKKQVYSSNIGFIYAYNDPQYVGKYFLIDGQQRITTIYLLLLTLGANVEPDTFQKYYYPNEILKVDYRVRESAQAFLNSFVKYILGKNDCTKENISQQYWYFAKYELDLTIQSIVNNYNFIVNYLIENELLNIDFFNYVQHYIEFWYFDTNLSDQGEELYIYMNARGEKIQTNENLKADLLGKLSTIEEKNKWGIIWEDWQDYFWKHRGENDNADHGFDEFIKCIIGLQSYLSNLGQDDLNTMPNTNLLELKDIACYIEALQYLENEKANFNENYEYNEWVEEYYYLIWTHLNKDKTDWLVDYKDQNKGTERNNMVLLWSFLYYYKANCHYIDRDEFFRVLRFFYVRYNNYNRSVSTLKKTIDSIIANGIIANLENGLELENVNPEEEETDIKFRTSEEQSKYTFLSNFKTNDATLKKYESLIWQIEDFPLNLDGKNLGNLNITHLVNFDLNPSLKSLKLIKERFELLTEDENYGDNELINCLLFYGEFWHLSYTNNYENYKFNEWGRIIRNMDGTKNAFSLFFKEFCQTKEPIPLEEILATKQLEFLNNNIHKINKLSALREQLIVYNMLLEDLWKFGKYIAVKEIANEPRIFENEKRIFNTKGDFRGYDSYELFTSFTFQKNDVNKILQDKLKALQKKLI